MTLGNQGVSHPIDHLDRVCHTPKIQKYVKQNDEFLWLIHLHTRQIKDETPKQRPCEAYKQGKAVCSKRCERESRVTILFFYLFDEF